MTSVEKHPDSRNTEDSGRPGSRPQGRHLLSVTLDSSTLNIRTYIMIATSSRYVPPVLLDRFENLILRGNLAEKISVEFWR